MEQQVQQGAGRGVRGLAVTVAGLAAVVLGVRWVGTAWEWTLPGSVRPTTSDPTARLRLLTQALTTKIGFSAAALLLDVAMMVVAAVWTARAHANAAARVPGSQRIPRGWAVTAAAIGLVGLVLLPRVHTDLWRAAEAGTEPGARRGTGWVWLWWAAWVASDVGSVATLHLAPLDLGDVTASPQLWAETALSVLTTVWLVGYASSILGVSARQEAGRRAATTV